MNLFQIIARIRETRSRNEVMRKGFGVLVANIAGTLFALVLQILLARILGAAEFGIYIYVLSWVTALQTVAVMGADTAIIRYVAAYRGAGAIANYWAFRKYSAKHVRYYTTATTLLLVLATVLLHRSLGDHKAAIFFVGALVLPAYVLMTIRGSILQGHKKVVQSQALQSVFRFAVIFSLLAVLIISAPQYLNALTTLGIYGIGAMASAIWLGAFVAKSQPECGSAADDITIKNEWRSVMRDMFVISGSQYLIASVSVLLIGMFMDSTQAGLFSVATRISQLVSFGITAVNMALAPTISELHARNDASGLQYTVTLAARGVAAFTVPVILLLITCGYWLLSLFGKNFVEAYPAMIILIIGQLVIALCGSVGFLLTMTGHQSDASKVIVCSGIGAVLLNLLLIPILGMIGAAVATMFVTAGRSLVLWIIVRRRLGIRPTALGV